MKKKIKDKLKNHDFEDKLNIGENIREMIMDEFEDAEEILAMLVLNETDGMPDDFLGQDVPVLTKKFNGFNIRKHTKSVKTYLHRHKYYELIYVYSGECTQYIGGKSNVQVVFENQACLLSPECVHALKQPKDKDIIIKLTISGNTVVSLAEKLYKMEFDLRSRLQKNNGVLLLNASPRSHSLLLGILDESLLNREFNSIALDSYVRLLLLELLRQPVKALDGQLKEEIEKYITGNMKGASLAEYAKLKGYSEGHTSRILKKECGESFTDIVMRLRVDKAAKLLLETNMSVENIAHELGYKNTSGLYKQFTEQYDMTPKKYRTLLS